MMKSKEKILYRQFQKSMATKERKLELACRASELADIKLKDKR